MANESLFMEEKLRSFNGEVIKLKYIRLAINLYKLLYLFFSKNGLCDLTLYYHQAAFAKFYQIMLEHIATF